MKKYFMYLNILTLAAILCLTVGCQDKSELEKFKQAETLKATNLELAKKFYTFLDAANLDSLRTICNTGAIIFYQSGEPVSLNDMEPFIKIFYTSSPDYKHNIDDMFAVDDKVVARITYTGTFKNKFMDINPTGAQFKYKGIQIFQFAENKVSNFWAVEDELGMMTQLGMELKPAKGKK